MKLTKKQKEEIRRLSYRDKRIPGALYQTVQTIIAWDRKAIDERRRRLGTRIEKGSVVMCLCPVDGELHCWECLYQSSVYRIHGALLCKEVFRGPE